MRTQGIYAITHTASGRVYVGSAINATRRWCRHRKDLDRGTHHCARLQEAWTEAGADAFAFSILEAVPLASDLLAREQWWINERNAIHALTGFNSCPVAGSPLGTKHSEATRAKMRASSAARDRATWTTIGPANRQRIVSAETRAKIAQNSRNISAETRAKLSLAHTGFVHSPESKAKMGARKGIRHTPESIAKMRESSKGQIMSPEARAKMSASHKARWARLRAEREAGQTRLPSPAPAAACPDQPAHEPA